MCCADWLLSANCYSTVVQQRGRSYHFTSHFTSLHYTSWLHTSSASRTLRWTLDMHLQMYSTHGSGTGSNAQWWWEMTSGGHCTMKWTVSKVTHTHTHFDLPLVCADKHTQWHWLISNNHRSQINDFDSTHDRSTAHASTSDWQTM